jgi:RNA polymerase sigma-70 factor (ECF subfamily)
MRRNIITTVRDRPIESMNGVVTPTDTRTNTARAGTTVTGTGLFGTDTTDTTTVRAGATPDGIQTGTPGPTGTLTVTHALRQTPLMPKVAGIEGMLLRVASGCARADGVFLDLMEAELPGDGHVTGPMSLDNFLGEVQRKAYHVAYGALWDQETALDVVQESMLRFVEYYRDKPATAWPALFRSVLNSRINDQRRKRLLASTGRKLLSLTGLKLVDVSEDEQLKEADLPADEHAIGAGNPENRVTAGQLRHAIDQAVGTLPERQRQVFLLREQLGLSIQESADTLGCSSNSIKQHHFRALRALRQQLAEVWKHEQV